jgi:hypothetical protein
LERNPTIRSIRVLSFGTPMKPIKQIPTDFFSLKKSLFWNATLQSVPICTIRSIRVLSFGTPMKPIQRTLTNFFFPKKEPVLECDLTIRA